MATDVDHDAVLTFAQVGSVAGLTINGDGTYSFNAGDAAYQNLKAGETLVVTANYSATDENSGTSSSTLTITLTGTNDVPVAVAGTNSGNEDTTITGSLVATDVDHDAVLTFAQVGSELV